MADFELAARSANLPPDPPPESIVSTGPPPESQDGRDARCRFSCPECGWGADSEPQLRCHSILSHGLRSAIVLDKPECPHCHRRLSSISGARHLHHQSCQRSKACTARAVHHEVAQSKDLSLPPPPGPEPPVIASLPTELASTPVDHVVLGFNGKSQEAQDRGLVEIGSAVESSDIPDLTRSRGDCSAPRLRNPVAHSLVAQRSLARQFLKALRNNNENKPAKGPHPYGLPHAGEMVCPPIAVAEPVQRLPREAYQAEEIEALSIQMFVAA